MAGASMKDIKLRIRSVESTMQITKAMQLVASSKLRGARARMEASKPYMKVARTAVWDIALHNTGAQSHYVIPRQISQRCYIVIAGDRGLAGSYNANMFKRIEWDSRDANCCVIPIGRKVHSYSGKYGVELLYDMMLYIYERAKIEKPHALVNCSPCHPYFAHICDQARLHDAFFAQRDSVRMMKERADLFSAMIPGLSIDTDSGSSSSRRDFLRYARASVHMGVPDIYILHPIEDCTLTPDDWNEIRLLWEAYRKENNLG